MPENGSPAHSPRCVRLNLLEKIGVWATVCRRCFLQWVDRPRAPRNLRSLTGEELAEKSHRLRRRRGDQTTIRRVLEGEEIDWRETWSPKKKKRFSPLALIPCGKRKKRRILNLLSSKKKKTILHIGLIHTHTHTHTHASETHNT